MRTAVAPAEFQRHSCRPSRPSPNPPVLSLQLLLTVFGCALLLGFLLYAPTLHAPFVFDDTGLPFARADRERPLSAWTSGVRPVLMFSYWLNRTLWGDAPLSYHAVNVLIHV